jgi:hypothetical protein
MNPIAWSHEGQTDYYDQPFVYVFDGDNLTDGLDYANLAQPLTSQSDFILRRIAGRPNVAAGGIRFRDRNAYNRQSAPYGIPHDYAVLPEIVYPPDAQIGFDLTNVLRANNPYPGVPGSVPNYYAQLAFVGARRFWGQRPPFSSYKYHSRPYVITTDVTIDWAGRIAPAYTQLEGPRAFSVLVDSHDFELQKIHGTLRTGISLFEYTPSSAAVKIVLYDQNQQALSTAPVLDSYMFDNNADYNSVFPTPTLLYKANSLIRFDIMSLLIDTQVPAVLTLDFIGAWRFPC